MERIGRAPPRKLTWKIIKKIYSNSSAEKMVSTFFLLARCSQCLIFDIAHEIIRLSFRM